MKDQIFNAFHQIHAEEALIEKTLEGMYSYRKKKERRVFFFRRGMAFAVSFAVMLCVGVTGWQAYFTEAFALTVDVNPSIEMGVNRFDKVISMKGFNLEGEQVLSSVDLKYKDYADAVDLLLEEEKTIGYLDEDGEVLIAVSSPKKEKVKQVKKRIDATQKETTQQVRVIQSKESIVEEAEKHDMSFGKYQAYLHIQEVAPEVTVEEVKVMTVKDMTAIIEGEKAEKPTTASSDSSIKEPVPAPETAVPSTSTSESVSTDAKPGSSSNASSNTGANSNASTNANTSATPHTGTSANTSATPSTGTNTPAGESPQTNTNTGASTNNSASTTPDNTTDKKPAANTNNGANSSSDNSGSSSNNSNNSNNSSNGNNGSSSNSSNSGSASDKKPVDNGNNGNTGSSASDKEPVDNGNNGNTGNSSAGNSNTSEKAPVDNSIGSGNVSDKTPSNNASGKAQPSNGKLPSDQAAKQDTPNKVSIVDTTEPAKQN